MRLMPKKVSAAFVYREPWGKVCLVEAHRARRKAIFALKPYRRGAFEAIYNL